MKKKSFFVILMLYFLSVSIPVFSSEPIKNIAPLKYLLAVDYKSQEQPNPSNNLIEIYQNTSGYIQPSLKVDSDDIGKKAKLLMYIYLPNVKIGFLLPSKEVTLEAIQKFTNIPDMVDFSNTANITFDIYFGYEINSTLKYNVYRIKVKEYYIKYSADDLTEKFTDFPINNVIKIKFTKELQFSAVKKNFCEADKPLGVWDLTEVDASQYFKVQYKGKDIPGKIYISKDKKELYFIPEEFLNPNSQYKVFLRRGIKFSDNGYLDKDIIFTLTTSSQNNLAYISAPTFAKEGDSVDLSVSTSLKIWHLKWDFEEKLLNNDNSVFVRKVSHIFNDSGLYTIKVNITDIYGRDYTVEKNIDILQHPIKTLQNLDNNIGIANVNDVNVENISDNELKEVLRDYSDSVPYSVKADINYSDNESDFKDELISISMAPEKINEFRIKYIKKLIDSSKFLGIVDLMGYHAILSYEQYGDNTYKLKVLIDDYSMIINNFNYKGYYINLDIPDTNFTPLVYLDLFKVDNETIQNLKKYLYDNITGELPVLAIEENGDLVLYDTYNNGFSFGWHTIVHYYHKVKKEVHHIKKHIVNAFQKLFNIISITTINSLKDLKDDIKEFMSLDITKYLDSIKKTGDNIKDSFNTTSSTISKVVSKNDPDELFSGLMNQINNDKVGTLKYLVEDSLSAINAHSNEIKQIGDSINKFIDKTFNSDKTFYFHITSGKDIYFYLQNGHKRYDFSLSKFNKLLKYSNLFFQKVGNDFPLKDIINTMNYLKNHFPAPFLTGVFASASGEHSAKYLLKFGSLNHNRCNKDFNAKFCFDSYVSSTITKTEMEIGINPSNNQGILITFSPASPILPEIEGAEYVYDFLQKNIAIFPKTSFLAKIKCDEDNIFKLVGSTFPDIQLQGQLEFRLDFNYYYIIGGNGNAGILLGIGIDSNGLENSGIELLEELLGNAINAAKSVILPSQEHIVTTSSAKFSVITMPSDEKFIQFVNVFLDNLKKTITSKQLTELTNNINFYIGTKAMIGLGLGGGGTGSGGIDTSLSLGGAAGIKMDLTLFSQYIEFLAKNQVKTFFLTPIYSMGELFRNSAESSITKSLYSNNLATQSMSLSDKTFLELVKIAKDSEKESENSLEKLMDILATHMQIFLSGRARVNFEEEEVQTIKGAILVSPTISFNGETLFNYIYQALYWALPKDKEYYGKLFDHKGIYPEITISMPISGVISAGFDEGIEMLLVGKANGNWFKGKFSIEEDPSLTNSKRFASKVYVNVTSDKTEVKQGDNVTFTCNVHTNDESSNYSTQWFINGKNDIIPHEYFELYNKKVAYVETLSKDKLELSKIGVNKGTLNISCVAITDKNNKNFHSFTLYINGSK